MSLAIIIGIVIGILVILGLVGKYGDSASVVVTGRGVIKTHNVEARFRSGTMYHGKLGQDRWSDGQERFSLRLNKLTADHDGTLRLFRNGDEVSEFEITDSAISFRWKGISSDAIPQFDIGDQLRVEVGSMSLNAIVEAD
ncbi:hypothetical protein [Altererythrobacter lutimaris]|uniref:Uncharacterized protein n=1 Tax=Altererythrobacter lutimaris TaxID=2743979 RepID=A0A850HCM4_9SPHN|nr:hypothetical protein [Altererythrobacter lutimaris]NVE95963.1 hypothetical protein [Altererythrobacter lutimaris]